MKKYLLPFAVSVLTTSILTACGGESNNIHENPSIKPDGTNAIGCTAKADSDSCLEFLMEYPVAGLQYTCSGDKVNTFGTIQNGNIISGGCNVEDTVTFFLNTTDNLRIEFGSVKLSDLGRVSAKGQPLHLTLLDMARGLTGQAAQSISPSDPTVAVALKLVKILQAVGNQRALANEIGDIQPITLKDKAVVGLDEITAKIDLQALENNTYIDLLKPWIDVTKISDDQAFEVLQTLINLSLGAIYQADQPLPLAAMEGLIGYSGTGSSQKTLLGTFIIMSDRQGYTYGYGMQWRGSPSGGTGVTGATTLLTDVMPIMMRASAQANWINPINKRIGTVDKFKFVTTNNENLFINQGRLINDYAIAGSQAFYKNVVNTDKVVEEDLSSWTLSTNNNEQYKGHADVLKAYPLSYLDKRVFKSERNVAAGEKYYFPLYATLTFRHNDPQMPTMKLGIVIDEFGDIRTDIKKDATDTDLSGQCGVVANAREKDPIDHFGEQQYRIGTVGAANYQPLQQDLAVSPRIILAGSQFGLLDGVMLGVSTTMQDSNGTSLSTNNNGVKINIYNLLMGSGTNLGNINITSYDNRSASWLNAYHTYKNLFIAAKGTDYEPTELEKQQIKSTTGGVSIQLADCYEVKTKS